ncbi:amino acid adenylation domain-containing protein, partial [Actinoplanes sp. NEAU-A12]
PVRGPGVGAGDPDPVALRRAFTAVCDRHEALRSTFPVVDDEPVQRVHEHLPIGFVEHDGAAWDDDRVRAALHEAAYAPFDLAEGPLVRLTLVRRAGGGPDHLVIALHHLITDLWSMELLLHELDESYRAERAGRPGPRTPAPIGFSTAARWQADRLAGEHGQRLRDFWAGELAGAPTDLDLPTDRPRPAEQRFRGGTHRFRLDREVAERLTGLARRDGTTLFTVLLTAYQVLLSRYTGHRDVVVGSPVHGRSRADFADAVGCFMNTAVLRGTIAPGESFRQLLRRTAQRSRTALQHAELPLPRLVEMLKVPRDASRQPLVQAMFGLHRSTGAYGTALAAFSVGHGRGDVALGDLRLTPVPLDPPHVQTDLMLTFAESEDGLGGLLQYDADLFTAETAQRMATQLRTLLLAIAADPDRTVGALPLLTEAERATQLYARNDTALAYDPADFVFAQVARRAAAHPDALAVAVDAVALPTDEAVSADTVRAVPTLTYRQLDEAANRLARRLIRHGVGPERIVAVHLPRSADLAVTLLAVHKAGGAYLPIDPDLPAERIGYMLADAGVSLVVGHAETTAALPLPAGVASLELDRLDLSGEPATAPPVRLHPANLAYVLYTSGSTGRPKGVQIQHGSMVNFLAAMRQMLDPAPGARLLALTTFSFDISVLEIFLPLLTGGTTHIVAGALRADGEQLRVRLDSGAFRFMQATPASWQMICDAGWRGTPGLTVLSGGEALSPGLAERLSGLGDRLWNLYGPTETTVWSSAEPVSGPVTGTVPLGRPVANNQIYVLDASGEPVPPGVPGEIYIGGDGGARGYRGRPDITAERFVPDPYASRPGARMYRTGDLARSWPDGRLEYLGRTDHQVKFKGHRIELGEIEVALSRQPAVRAAVLRLSTVGGLPALVAYLQPRHRVDTAAFDRHEANRQLRAALREQLPGYMVPTHFVWLDDFPLNASGKIDRAALPAPEHVGGRREEPVGEVEQALAGIVADLLGGAAVGRRDNLFDLGAHSLMLSRLVTRVDESLGIRLPLHRLFDAPTVQQLAVLVDASRVDGSERTAAPEITRVDRGDYAGTHLPQPSAALRKFQAVRRLRARSGE